MDLYLMRPPQGDKPFLFAKILIYVYSSENKMQILLIWA